MRVSEYAVGMTAKCPKCGQSLQLSEENATPIVERHYARQAPEAEVLPQVAERQERAPQATRCVRCGRLFRGDWDRHQSDKGILCLICADITGKRKQKAESDTRQVPHGLSPADDEAKEADPRIRLAVAIASGLVIVITLYYVLSGEGPVPPGVGVSIEDVPPPRVQIPAGVVYTLNFFFRILSVFLALYFALRAVDSLPRDTLAVNTLILVPVAAVLYVVPWLLWFYPMVGPGLCIGAHIILTLFIANEFQMGISGLFHYIVFRILAAILVRAIRMLVYGALGLIIA